MLSWTQKRKTVIIGVIGLGLLLFWALSWRILFYRPVGCFDNIKNGNERGVDCGGSCRLLCEEEAQAPLVHFARALEVAKGVWGAVAYLENRNANAAALSAAYLFKLYDTQGILVAERHGRAYIPPQKVFAIFEGALLSGDRVPTRASFEFTRPVRFERAEREPTLSFENKKFAVTNDTARLEATLVNTSAAPLAKVVATALLFGSDGNVFAASQTEVAAIATGGSVPLSFTWPRPLQEPTRIELLFTTPPL